MTYSIEEIAALITAVGIPFIVVLLLGIIYMIEKIKETLEITKHKDE